MLSKCANPECHETFRYLHEGKIFRLYPNPILRASAPGIESIIAERFWLCADCCQKMTIVWAGSRVKLVPLPKKVEHALVLFSARPQSLFSPNVMTERKRAASAAGDN